MKCDCREGAGRLAGGRREAVVLVSAETPAPQPTTIYLVDKPGAAQSTFAIGIPGPPRNTPDYYALQVMNTILGGQFQSRLNANIREEKGYSYGVTSSFAYGKGPGAFRAGGDIVSAKTDAALVEFMKELKGIVGSRPMTDEELTTAKDALDPAAARGLRVGGERQRRDHLVVGAGAAARITTSSTRRRSAPSRKTTCCGSRRSTSMSTIWRS